MGLRVLILHSQTHAHKLIGSSFLPINKPVDREIDSNSCHNRVKTHRVLDFGYMLSSLCVGVGGWGRENLNTTPEVE